MSTTPTSTPCESFLNNLIGNWSGQGSVFGFSLGDKVVYYDVEMSAGRPMGGKTVQKFVQSHLESRHAEKKVGMHFESGFWRCGATSNDEITWMIAHNSGNVEAVEGKVSADGKSAVLESQMIGGFPETQKTKREISFDDKTGEMKYLFYMQTLSYPKMTPHLQMTFNKMQEGLSAGNKKSQ